MKEGLHRDKGSSVPNHEIFHLIPPNTLRQWAEEEISFSVPLAGAWIRQMSKTLNRCKMPYIEQSLSEIDSLGKRRWPQDRGWGQRLIYIARTGEYLAILAFSYLPAISSSPSQGGGGPLPGAGPTTKFWKLSLGVDLHFPCYGNTA